MNVGAVVGIGLLLVGCATPSFAADEDSALPFGCDDVVLIGRLKNGDYQPVDTQGDILGHGWIAARLHVRRAMGGAKVPSVVSVRYLAHAYLREDREFLFVAKQATDGVYVVNTAQLTSSRPKLASRCN